MVVTRISLVGVLLATVVVSSCSSHTARITPPRARGQPTHLVGPVAWHMISDRRCLTSGGVRQTRFVRARSAIYGAGACGVERPFVVDAGLGGAVGFQPAATLRCPMVAPVDYWLRHTVQPAARRYFAQPVVRLKIAASYACRTRNSRRNARLSEHARANALDVSAFWLADGTRITVKRGWRSWGAQGRFLRTVHNGACRQFTTVLGPDADRYHHDHFHLDLARHGRTGSYRVCR